MGGKFSEYTRWCERGKHWYKTPHKFGISCPKHHKKKKPRSKGITIKTKIALLRKKHKKGGMYYG